MMGEREQAFSGWVNSRPEAVRDLMVLMPPEAEVKAREGHRLLCPAPGVVGRVVSWFEDGTVGVVAPMATSLTSPITGESVAEGEVIKGQCHPEDLEIVAFAQLDEDIALDHEFIRGLIEPKGTNV